MRVHYHRRFDKHFCKLPLKIQQKTIEKIALFIDNPFSPLLNNHALSGRQEGMRSISITGDFRAIYDPVSASDALFVDIGTHSQLYG